jgi:hypothetical protein
MELGVDAYIALQPDWQPWAPSRPGEHGLVVFPARVPEDASVNPTSYEVFVQQIAEEHLYRYIGQYAPTEVEPLAREDWLKLDEKVRLSVNLTPRICCADRVVHLQVKAVFSKASSSKLCRHNCREDYDAGKLRAEVILLRYTGFNHSLYSKLSEVPESEGEVGGVIMARDPQSSDGGQKPDNHKIRHKKRQKEKRWEKIALARTEAERAAGRSTRLEANYN